jgi:hypothetical protein
MPELGRRTSSFLQAMPGLFIHSEESVNFYQKLLSVEEDIKEE